MTENMPLGISCLDSAELIDENHPDVMALIGAGYSAEDSICAFREKGTRIAALEHLEKLEVGESSIAVHDDETSHQDNFVDWYIN